VWQKLNYLRSILAGFSFRYIRYCTFTSSHLIVNDREKWAYLVHDPGTVVSSEISFETVDYHRAVELFKDILTGIYFENEPVGLTHKQSADQKVDSTGENFYEFIQGLKRQD
jgi:hypothetical protein